MMGLFSRFLRPKEIHLHLHIDGELSIKTDAGRKASSISKTYEAVSERQRRKIADLGPELENIDIPDVDFGDTVDG